MNKDLQGFEKDVEKFCRDNYISVDNFHKVFEFLIKRLGIGNNK